MSYKNSDENYKAFPRTPRHKTGTKRHKNSGEEPTFVHVQKSPCRQSVIIEFRHSEVRSLPPQPINLSRIQNLRLRITMRSFHVALCRKNFRLFSRAPNHRRHSARHEMLETHAYAVSDNFLDAHTWKQLPALTVHYPFPSIEVSSSSARPASVMSNTDAFRNTYSRTA
jgi:hypothetical protein